MRIDDFVPWFLVGGIQFAYMKDSVAWLGKLEVLQYKRLRGW